jgi:hypothetical protein
MYPKYEASQGGIAGKIKYVIKPAYERINS